jgi:hypothetical protein
MRAETARADDNYVQYTSIKKERAVRWKHGAVTTELNVSGWNRSGLMKTVEVEDKTNGDVAGLRRWRGAKGRIVGRSRGVTSRAVGDSALNVPIAWNRLWQELREVIPS